MATCKQVVIRDRWHSRSGAGRHQSSCAAHYTAALWAPSVAVLTQLTQPKCRWAKSCIIYRGLLGVSSVEQCAAASLSNGPHGGGCWITDGNVLWPNSGVLRQMDHHPRHAAVLSLFLKRLLARLNTLIGSAWSSCRVSTPFVSRTLSPKGILWILRYVGFKSIS